MPRLDSTSPPLLIKHHEQMAKEWSRLARVLMVVAGLFVLSFICFLISLIVQLGT